MFDKLPHYPAVCCQPYNQKILATAGIQLEAILAANLLPPTSANNIEGFGLASRNFVRSLCGWPSSMFVELHWTCWPHLADPARGRIDLTLTVNCLADDQTTATTEVLARFQPLLALVLSHFPEAVFAPIFQKEALRQRLRPFQPQHSVALTRQQQRLEVKLGLPLAPPAIGFLDPGEAGKTRTTAGLEHLFPWLPSDDSLHRFLDFLLWYPEPVWLRLRLQPHPEPQAEDDYLRETIVLCEQYLRDTLKASESILEQQILALRDLTVQRRLALTQGQVRLAVLLGASHHLEETLLQLTATSFLGRTDGSSAAAGFQGGVALRPLKPEAMLDPLAYPDAHACTPEEAACWFRLPHPPQAELQGIPIQRWRSAFAELPADNPVEPGRILLGHNVHRGFRQPVSLATLDRCRHCFIVGQTGTGKSTLLENFILQDIEADRGLCLIDPDGDLTEAILQKYPWRRRRDLVLLDLSDSRYPFALNLLACQTEDERDFLVDDLYATIDQLYDLRQTGGPMFEKYFRGLLRLLMSVDRKFLTPTILELPLIFSNWDFRHFCLRGVNDRATQQFVREIERVDGEAKLANMAPYVTSKLNRFVQDQRLRRIFGQTGLSLDFYQFMNQGKVVLVNLRKGIFGPTVSALVARQLVARFQTAAMQRAFLPPEKRREFFLYVDECHNVVNENFASLLSEARKYKLGLILCTQYTEQLQKAWTGRYDTLVSAILGNVGTMIAFRLGLADAQRLAGIFVPTFDTLDLLHLPNWEAYVKLSLAGRYLPAFNLQTQPAPPAVNTPQQVRQLRAGSRRRYCRPAAQVDAEIQERWRRLEELQDDDYDDDSSGQDIYQEANSRPEENLG